MGHSVTALLGSQSVLARFTTREQLQPPVQAEAGVWLVPLTDDVLDRVVGIPVGETVPGFNYLFAKLLPKLEVASKGGWLVYVETEYFGGVGEQGAVALREGSIIYGPATAEGDCINRALSSVGIKVVAPAHDEFETVGLHMHRWTNDWLPDDLRGDA